MCNYETISKPPQFATATNLFILEIQNHITINITSSKINSKVVNLVYFQIYDFCGKFRQQCQWLNPKNLNAFQYCTTYTIDSNDYPHIFVPFVRFNLLSYAPTNFKFLSIFQLCYSCHWSTSFLSKGLIKNIILLGRAL